MPQLNRLKPEVIGILIAVIGLLLFAQNTQAFAQKTPATKNGAASQTSPSKPPQFTSTNWNVSCQPNATAKKLVCELSRTITLAQTGQLFMKISIGAKPLYLVLQLPHGLKLDEGVKIQIDDKKIVPIKFFTSNQAGAFTRTMISNEMLSALKSGSRMNITVHSTNGKALVTPISLLGFSLGFDRLN